MNIVAYSAHHKTFLVASLIKYSIFDNILNLKICV